jgi:diguanylate cyclase (GGDEF)-like protein
MAGERLPWPSSTPDSRQTRRANLECYGATFMVTRKAIRGEENFQVPTRSQEIRKKMHALASRDLQLLSVSLLLLLVLASGVLALIYLNLISARSFRAKSQKLPQLWFGLIALMVLFNVYIIFQKRDLNSTHRHLVEELILDERMEAISLTDPTTQLFNRRAMEQMLSQEQARTNRLGSALCLLVLDTIDFETINNKLGTQDTDRFLYKAAGLVKNTLRRSDMVFHHAESKFLVVMRDTTEQQADFPIKRLLNEVERYNAEHRSGVELDFGYGVSQYAHGSHIRDTLQTAERKAFLRKHHSVPVF